MLSAPIAGAAALTLVLTGCGGEEGAAEDPTVAGQETDVREDDAPLEDTAALEHEEPVAADPATAEPGTLLAGDASVFDAVAAADPAAALEPLAGEPVVAALVPVLAVPTDEGFWIGTEAEPVWAQLVEPWESPVDIGPGESVSFTGELVANEDGFVDQLGLPTDQAARLATLGYHVEVPADDIAMG